VRAQHPSASAVSRLTTKQMRQLINNTRRIRGIPRIPVQTISNTIFPPELHSLNNGSQFLQYSSLMEDDEDRFFIFSTVLALNCLSGATQWYVDSTFKTCPAPFKAMWIIHAHLSNKTLPLVYILLPNQLETTYGSVLREINNIRPIKNSVEHVMLDFEPAQYNAMRSFLPRRVQFQGFFFYFRQFYFRRVHKIRNLHPLLVDMRNSFMTKYLVALAFVHQ